MSSIDPLAFFPPEISEIIFENLTATHLKSASLSSTAWHQYIAKSKQLMKKFKLTFHCDQHNVMSALMESDRLYENLEVKSCMQCLRTIFPLLTLHEWKNVKIHASCIESSEEASEFFTKIQDTVEVLEISEVYVRKAYTVGRNENLKFPKLKVLRSVNIQSFLYYDIFANIKTLEEFKVVSHTQNVASLNSILELLKVNVNLKKLEFTGRIFHQVFFHDLTEFAKFKLEEISVTASSIEEPFQDRVFSNFKKLIESQKNLKQISINKWMGEDVMKVILEVPLKELEIFNDIPSSSLENFKNLTLRVNPKIKILNLDKLCHKNEIAMKIVGHLPNLESYKCRYSDEKFMEFLGENGKNLKNLEIEFLNVDDYNKYKILKTVKKVKIENRWKLMEGGPDPGNA
jgi:hypothetical protein